jgi:translation initiation factor IF-2
MAKQSKQTTPEIRERPPIIAVMGHIDHGKSTLLDYIRETNVVSEEAGGITQRLSAYEIPHTDQHNIEHKITFLDTPGHEAFEHMRSRGASVADIGILIVAATEGVKAQTMEALQSIIDAGIPYIVAINKVDQPDADVERTKYSLLENGIYLEGMGGNISWISVSAKTGQGVPELLDLLLLQAEMEEISGDANAPAEGVVIESHVDPKKGTSATLLIQNGTLAKGQFVVASTSFAPVRIMENFLGEQIDEATFSSPVSIAGFNDVPPIGARFMTVEKKKEAEKMAEEQQRQQRSSAQQTQAEPPAPTSNETITIPLVIKGDVAGSIDAVEYSVNQLNVDYVQTKIIHTGVGNVTESDIKVATGEENTIVVGFNVQEEKAAKELAERYDVTTETFDIIYKLTEWLEQELERRRPRVKIEEDTGSARVLKTFSRNKDKQVIGCRLENGRLQLSGQCRIKRKDEEIARGRITNLQQQKADVQEVTDGEFGAEIQSDMEIASGDLLEGYVIREH